MPNMPASHAEHMKGQLGSEPTQATTIQVTKIETRDLPPDTFAAPTGFAKPPRNTPNR